MAQYRVTFEPGHRTVAVEAGTALSDAAAAAGVRLSMSCGGQGVCGQCAVLAQPGEPGEDGSEAGGNRGRGAWILACQTPVTGDLVVDVARSEGLAARLEEAVSDADARLLEQVPRGDGRPLVRTVTVRLSPPSVHDNASDLSRMYRAVRQLEPDLKSLAIDLKVLQVLPRVLRRSDWEVNVTVADLTDTARIIAVTPARPGTSHQAARSKTAAGRHALTTVHGVAIDVGTSTVAVQLVDVAHAISLGVAVGRNAQARYGEDVISRIIYSEEHPNGLEELRAAVLETINGLLDQVTRTAGLQPHDVMAASVAGNTTMTSMLLGIEPGAIRRAPHIPPARDLPVFTAAEVGLRIHPEAAVFLHPAVSGFVGGDITAGVVATGIDQTEQLCLLIDVGTNGEIVVGNSEWLTCCSCSAGPAFEGVGIEAGMHAVRGAVEHVRYDAAKDAVEYEVIGKTVPLGICGTGLLEALASLFRAGVLDRNGQFNEHFPTGRLRRGEYQLEFVIVPKGENGAEKDLVLTQADVEHLIRSKAAVHAGITFLLQAVGLRAEQIEKFYIAGAFGTHLDLPSAMAIGMVPEVPASRIEYAGNSSLGGACASLMARAARDRVRHIARSMTYVELSGEPSFMEEYVASMFLPHTDLSRFPSVARLAGAGNSNSK
ncbi:MAG: ASKHA domain-containing protein [Armatimonadetes bacterium]|nr:ASKHA domain-containing protein [Armatimonadota bacterium]